MASLTQEQTRIVTTAAIITVVFLLVLGWYWITMGRKTVESRMEQVTATEASIRELDIKISDMNELLGMQDQYDLIAARLESISRRLPPTPEAPGFLNALSQALRLTGIHTERLVPERVVEYDRITEIPYGITAVGRYHEIGQFLNLVEENPQRFMRVKTMSIKNDPTRPSLHPVTIQIGTFMFVE